MSAQGRPKRSPPPMEGEADREAVSFGGGYPTSAQGRPKRSPPPMEGEADREAVSFGGGYPTSAQGHPKREISAQARRLVH
jgi:hypothetical protein